MLYIYSIYGLVAQWTRARGYEPRCQGFESLLAQYSYYIDSKIDIYIQFPYNLLKMGRRQAVRQRTLTPPFVGSNPPASDLLLTDYGNLTTNFFCRISIVENQNYYNFPTTI